MSDKTADAYKFVLRLPKPLMRRLKQQAKRNSVSLNTEIVNQLEGYEAATLKRTTEIMQPLLEEAVRASAATAAGVAAEVMLLGIFRPRTEADLLEHLEQIDAPKELAERALAAFRTSEAAKQPEKSHGSSATISADMATTTGTFTTLRTPEKK